MAGRQSGMQFCTLSGMLIGGSRGRTMLSLKYYILVPEPLWNSMLLLISSLVGLKRFRDFPQEMFEIRLLPVRQPISWHSLLFPVDLAYAPEVQYFHNYHHQQVFEFAAYFT